MASDRLRRGLWGVVALIEGDDSGDSVTIVFAELSFLDLRSTGDSPAIIEFRLTQPSSVPASTRLRFRDPGSGELRDCTLVETTFLGELLNTNLEDLETAPEPDGVVHRKAWDFETDLGGGALDGLTLDLSVVDADGNPVGDPAPTGGPISIGNDPPFLAPIAVAPPLSGVVLSGDIPFTLNLQDSSSDPVNLFVEYAVVSDPDGPGGSPPADDPSLQWIPIRPIGGEDQPAPEPTFASVGTTPEPSFAEFDFSWASLADLGATQPFVRLRVRAVETVGEGIFAEQVTDPFQVDNNDPPEIVVSEGALVLNADRRGGIPIPFELTDAESDPVRVAVQWTPQGEPFPAISQSLDEFRALNSAERQALQVGTIGTTIATGEFEQTQAATSDEEVSALRLDDLEAIPGVAELGVLAGATVQILRDKNEVDVAAAEEAGVPIEVIDLAPWPGDPSTRWAILSR